MEFSIGFPETVHELPPRRSNAFVRESNRLAVAGLSNIGRPGFVKGTRELVEPPYSLVYSVEEAADQIVVLAIVHGARNREG